MRTWPNQTTYLTYGILLICLGVVYTFVCGDDLRPALDMLAWLPFVTALQRLDTQGDILSYLFFIEADNAPADRGEMIAVFINELLWLTFAARPTYGTAGDWWLFFSAMNVVCAGCALGYTLGRTRPHRLVWGALGAALGAFAALLWYHLRQLDPYSFWSVGWFIEVFAALLAGYIAINSATSVEHLLPLHKSYAAQRCLTAAALLFYCWYRIMILHEYYFHLIPLSGVSMSLLLAATTTFWRFRKQHQQTYVR
jgi:hypothetical protein